MRIKFLLVTIAFLHVLVTGPKLLSQGTPTPPKQKVVTALDNELIADMAILKLMALSKSVNIRVELKLSGQQEAMVEDKLKKVCNKYGLNPNKLTPVEQKPFGWRTDPAPEIYIDAPDDWSEIVQLLPVGKLPVVQFKKGRISWNYDLASIVFQEGMDCSLKNKEYVFQQGQWLEMKK